MRSFKISVIFILAWASAVHAQTFTEKSVQAWLQSPTIIENNSDDDKKRILVVLNKNLNRSFNYILNSTDQKLNVKNSASRVLRDQFRDDLKFFKNKSLVSLNKIDPLWAINGFITQLTKAEATELMKNPMIQGLYDANKKITLPPPRLQPFLQIDYTYGLKNIKVPDLNKTNPELKGDGVVIGVIDTGLSINHPDLKGRMILFKNFSPSPSNDPVDPFGHGTHVSGTIAGGSVSGLAIGVAPRASLVVGRIFDGNGESTRELILKAMQWMIDPDENPATNDQPRVVNNSWGDDEPYSDREPANEPFCQILESWLMANIVPVFSAGNTGPRAASINLPAGCSQSFAVGATEQWDRSPHFSSEGPAVWKSVSYIKPDVAAPGMDIKSASHNANGYEVMSGTSMAAPHVSGAFALLFQSQPELTATQAMNLMKSGAKDLGNVGQDTTFGFGRIDIQKSIELSKATVK